MDRTGENVEELDVNRYAWKRALGASGPSRTNLSLSSASGNNTLLYLVCQMSDVNAVVPTPVVHIYKFVDSGTAPAASACMLRRWYPYRYIIRAFGDLIRWQYLFS